MSVRSINYTVSEDGVSPDTSQWGGIQYENNATSVSYTIEETLGEKIHDNYPKAEKIFYRIDFDSPTAGYHPSENLEITDGTVSRDIPIAVTASGEPFLSTLVITVLDGELNEIGTFCSKPSRIYFNGINREQYSEQIVFDNVSAMEESVSQKQLQIVEVANNVDADAKAAAEALQKTIDTKLSLENGCEFVFLGGDAATSATADVVIDDKLIDTSSNLVQSKAISAAINDAVNLAVSKAKLASHPIGSYYWSEEATDPSILFGGVWQQVSESWGDTQNNIPPHIDAYCWQRTA